LGGESVVRRKWKRKRKGEASSSVSSFFIFHLSSFSFFLLTVPLLPFLLSVSTHHRSEEQHFITRLMEGKGLVTEVAVQVG
jgi:hypothetical protein